MTLFRLLMLAPTADLSAWFLRVPAVLALVLALVGTACDAGEDAQPGNATDAVREDRLRGMRERAESLRLQLLHDRAAGEPVSLRPEPFFRYSDQPRGILDATIWGWRTEGRPPALCKIEIIPAPSGKSYWQYCVVSLSDELIEMEWDDGQDFRSSKSGVEFRRFPGAPDPAGRKVARRFQMKRLARRFDVTIYVDGRPEKKQKMRLLPRPVVRYANAEAGLLDGAAFGFATNGTNPDMLLLIELGKEDRAAPAWRYGLARMTKGELHVRLKGRKVWKALYDAPRKRWAVRHQPREE